MRTLALRGLLTALILVGALALAACGGDSDTGPSTTPESTETTDATESSEGGGFAAAAMTSEPSEEAVKALLDEVFGTQLDEAALEPWVTESFEVAAQELTPEQEAFVSDCIQNPTCSTGQGELVIGLADSYGANGYRKAVRAGFAAALSRFPQVSEFIYTDAAGDLQKAQSDMRSMISKNVDAIIGEFDFGDAMLPVMKQAAAAGIPVIAFTQTAQAAQYGGKDLAHSVTTDTCELGELLGGATVDSGTDKEVAMYSGPAGNPSAAIWQPCAEETISAAGGKVVIKGNTEWTPQGETQAASALLAKGLPESIIYDYTPTSFINAIAGEGKVPPFISAQAIDMGSLKAWKDATAKVGEFGFQAATNTSGWTIPTAFLAVADALEEPPAGIPDHVELPLVPIPIEELEQYYLPEAGSGAPFGTGLPKSIQIEAQTAQ